MAKFDASNLDPTEYDFTPYPRQDGNGFCSGKGVVAEPSDDQIDAFQAAAMKLDTSGSGDGPTYSEGRAAVSDALENLNVPREHIDELPPKYFGAFVGFLVREFVSGPTD